MSIWTKDSRGHLVSSTNPLEVGAVAGAAAFALAIWLCKLFGLVGEWRMILSVIAGALVFAVVAKAIWPKGTAGAEGQEPAASPQNEYGIIMHAEKMVGRVITGIRVGEHVFGGSTATLTSDAKSDSAYEFILILDDGSEWTFTGKHDEDVVIRQRQLNAE